MATLQKLIIPLTMVVVCLGLSEFKKSVRLLALKAKCAKSKEKRTAVLANLTAKLGGEVTTYDDYMQELTEGITPRMTGASCLTDPKQFVARVIISGHLLKKRLFHCQKILQDYVIDSRSGCVYAKKVSKFERNAFGKDPSKNLLRGLSQYERTSSIKLNVIAWFKTPCDPSQVKSYSQKLQAVRQYCKVIYSNVKRQNCDSNQLVASVVHLRAIQRCIVQKLESGTEGKVDAIADRCFNKYASCIASADCRCGANPNGNGKKSSPAKKEAEGK